MRSIDDVLQDNGHPEIVYHKDGGNTHAMRFAKEEDGEEIENHTGKWYYGTLVDYYGFPTRELRDAMMDNDWGNGKIDFSDARIAEALEKAKGDYDIPLDTGSDEEGSTDNPCS